MRHCWAATEGRPRGKVLPEGTAGGLQGGEHGPVSSGQDGCSQREGHFDNDQSGRKERRKPTCK